MATEETLAEAATRSEAQGERPMPNFDSADGSVAKLLLSPNERTPSDIERQVLAVSMESRVDELCAAIDAADWLLARAKEVDRLKKEVAIAWIDRHGEFDFGAAHYSVGYSYDVKCLDVPQTGHAVLAAAGGDFDQFLSVLTSQPFKHASVRSFVGKALHDRLFRAHRTGRLVHGVPERTLKRTDTRFLPQRRQHPNPSQGGDE
jgi:hypothetical protein